VQQSVQYTPNTLITAATTISYGVAKYYPFTMRTAASYSITAYEITSVNVGHEITFKRLGGSLQNLTFTLVNASGTGAFPQPIFLLGTTLGTVTSPQTIISTTQNCVTMTSLITQTAGAGTFTNIAGSATVTIVTVTSGTLAIGGWVTLNGNERQIIAYGTGLGLTGTYTVNAVIAGANTGQAFTSNVSYGWGVLHQG
jgi:hypothetical protein